MLLAEVACGFVLDSWEIDAIVRLLVSAALGATIGLEREQHGRSAGLRTHMLVSLGAAMAMVVSLHFGQVYADAGGAIRVDPARVAYGVMAGVGFLGAGAIIHYGAGVRGLTTAASLWCSAAIGLGAGFGLFAIAAAGTAIVLFALVVLDYVERLIPVKLTRTVAITVPDTSDEAMGRYRRLLTEAGAKVVNVTYSRDYQNNQATIMFRLSVRSRNLEPALEALRRGAPELRHLRLE